MAVIRVCFLVFIALLHKYVPVLSKTFERLQSDSISTTFPEEFSERIDLLETQLGDKFTDLSQQIKDLAGQRDHSHNEAMIELTKEISKLKTAVRNMTSRQENFENKVKRMFQNNTFAMTLKFNNVERNLQNISSNTLQLNSSVNHLSDKIDNVWRSSLQPSISPSPWSPSQSTTDANTQTTTDVNTQTTTPTLPSNGTAEGTVRLAGGTATRGRVEIYHNGRWGTVCDDSWGDVDARVVCRMLGFGNYTAKALISFGGGVEPTWMDDVGCTGHETTLTRCTFRGWGLEDCSHSEDAGVECHPSEEVRVRLAGGTTSRGRVEVYHAGRWGTVCDDDWGDSDAGVVCRMLGFGNSTARALSSFGGGSGPTWMDNVECSGDESTISLCRFRGWGQEDCSHSEDAGVDCNFGAPGEVRLVGDRDTRGRVEIFHDGRWGTVCDDDWDHADASVVCRMLGFSNHTAIAVSAFGGGSDPIWMDNVACEGDESALSDCTFRGWGERDCAHTEDAGVECKPPGAVYEGDIRLVNGTALEGRVEIYHNSKWGTVCDDDFGSADARVVCRQLQYSGGRSAARKYGAGTGDIWMDGLRCEGDERRLADCRFNGWGSNDCSHSEDVGVVCDIPTAPSPTTSPAPSPTSDVMNIRLVGGTAPYEGRVEVFHNNQWGTVCDDAWGNPDAEVVCRSLGYIGGVATSGGSFGEGVDPTWLDQVQCRGNESSLSDCQHNGWGEEDCSHREDAGVRCRALTTAPPMYNVTADIEVIVTSTESSTCDPVSVLPCLMPLTDALTNMDPTNMTSICYVYNTFKQCVSQLPENCQNETMSAIPQASLQQVELFCGSITGTEVCDTGAAMDCLTPYTSAMANLDPSTGLAGVCGPWRNLKTCLNALPGSCQSMLTGLGVESQRDMMDATCGTN